MRKKAIVVAAVRQTPINQAILGIVDFMYGTPERTRITLWFAFGLAVLGALLPAGDNFSCGVDLLKN